MNVELKAKYEAPTVAKVGAFETATQHTNSGTTADILIPDGGSIIGHLS